MGGVALDHVHDFHTLDRQTQVSSVGVSLGFESWDHPPYGGELDQILTIDVAGQYVSASGAGAYLTLPFTYVGTRDLVVGGDVVVGTGESELSLGNIELGGLYAHRLDGHVDLVVHAGVAFSTADDTGVGQEYGYEGAFVRLPDLADRYPYTTWLRAGVSPMGHEGRFFWRFDVGVDVRVDHQRDDSISPILHVGAGAGVDLGKLEASAELAVLRDHPTRYTSDTDDTLSTVALGARVEARNVQPGLAVIFPISFDDFDAYNLAIAASVTARMP